MSTGSSSEALGSRANVKVGSIVVRCVRFDELVAFWQAALGYVPRVARLYDGYPEMTASSAHLLALGRRD